MAGSSFSLISWLLVFIHRLCICLYLQHGINSKVQVKQTYLYYIHPFWLPIAIFTCSQDSLNTGEKKGRKFWITCFELLLFVKRGILEAVIQHGYIFLMFQNLLCVSRLSGSENLQLHRSWRCHQCVQMQCLQSIQKGVLSCDIVVFSITLVSNEKDCFWIMFSEWGSQLV